MTAKESKAVALFTPEQLAGLADKATNRANREAAKRWPPGHDREITARNLQQRYYAEYITPPKMTFAAMQSALHAAEAELGELRRRVDAWKDFARHQEWCADCAESVASCADGKELKEAALASDGGADGDNT